MRVPLLDLKRQHALVRADVSAKVDALFESQQFILGPAVEELERDFANSIGVEFAIGMSSGTDAQLAILMALGIGPGDAVITTPYTFFATAGCIHRLGAEPVFVDVENDTLHLDPAALQSYLSGCPTDSEGIPLSRRGNRIRAVIPIHLFGACCRMDEITEIARAFRLAVTEDAAQAVGATYEGRRGILQAGTISDSAWFSFFPTKNLGGAGDGGMAVCRDAAFADQLRLIRNHGMEKRYIHRQVGGNFRLDGLQAAVIHAKLPYLAQWNSARRRNAGFYREAFLGEGLRDFIVPPLAPPAGMESGHIYHPSVVRALDRDGLMEHLQREQIGCAIYYSVPLHLQECFSFLGYRVGDLPVAEKAARESLALPIFPELETSELEAVVAAISGFYAK